MLQRLESLPGVSDLVWAALARLDASGGPLRLVVTSAEPRAGTTVIAAATAIGLVRHRRVSACLVETHVERPALAAYLGLRPAGLTDILDGRAELKDCLQEPRGCPDLFVLPAGTARAPVPGELVTERMRALLEQLGQLGRCLVLDAPALLGHIESRMLLQRADGALLVLRAGATRGADARRAVEIVRESGATLLGSILNAHGTALDPAPLLRASAAEDDDRDAWRDVERLSARALGAPMPPSVAGDEAREHGGNGHALGGAVAARAATNTTSAAPTGWISAEAHQRQIDLLERRIAKLNGLLERTEQALQRIAAMKYVDPGIASIYRGVQGLSADAEALASKRDLLEKIFQANLELKQAIATRR
ncbi:MAG: hypothetical protein EPO68_13400 [Planctomycetota bacterium]|nr:MAG: hypothetical protein EPO68_13400 [Planctomycetota bacterium]